MRECEFKKRIVEAWGKVEVTGKGMETIVKNNPFDSFDRILDEARKAFPIAEKWRLLLKFDNDGHLITTGLGEIVPVYSQYESEKLWRWAQKWLLLETSTNESYNR